MTAQLTRTRLLGRLVTDASDGPATGRHRIAGLRLDSTVTSERVHAWMAPWEVYRLTYDGDGWAVRSVDWLMASRVYRLTDNGSPLYAFPTRGGYPIALNADESYEIRYRESTWELWLAPFPEAA